MRREEPDFAAFVAARWPALVQRVVDAGVPRAAAGEVAADALSRCRTEWLRAHEYGDIDAVVDEALQRAVRRYDGAPGADGPDGADGGRDPGRPPSEDELDCRTQRRRRRTRRRAALGTVPIAAAVAAAVWWTAHGTEHSDRLDDAVVTTQEDQSQSVWYADGRLHLDHEILTVGTIRDVTSVGDGAVYLDPTGRVVRVTTSGERDVLGHLDPDLPLRADGASGWVAWVDAETGRTVVWDLTTGRRVATRDGDQRVVAVDFQEVYLRNGEGRLRDWQPLLSRVRRLPDVDLLDVRGRRQAIQSTPTTITVVQLDSSTRFTRPGTGAALSPHGGYVTTTAGEATLYDTLSGLLTRSGLRSDDTVLAAAGTSQGATTYVVQTAQGTRLLEDCVVRESACTIAEQLDPDGPVPLLAR